MIRIFKVKDGKHYLLMNPDDKDGKELEKAIEDLKKKGYKWSIPLEDVFNNLKQ